MHGAVACLPLLLRISDQKRQRFRSNPATISDSIPPQIPTEVRYHDGPLGGQAQTSPAEELKDASR